MTPKFDKQISSNGIAYARAGCGPSLVLIHGVGLRAESWAPLMQELKDDFDIIAIDLPGHGASAALEQDFKAATIADYESLIKVFIDDLGIKQCYVGGHSLGALIAIEIAQDWPQSIVGLAAFNAIYQRQDAALKAVQQRAQDLYVSDAIVGVEQTIQRWFGEHPEGVLADYARWCSDWLRDNSVSGYATAYKAFAAGTGPAANTLSKISCPALYMTGNLDPNSKPTMSREMANASPNASWRAIGDAAHMMPLTHAPQVALELIGLKHQVELSSLDQSRMQEMAQ